MKLPSFIFKKQKFGSKRIIQIFGILRFSYTRRTRKSFVSFYEHRNNASEQSQKDFLDEKLYTRCKYHIDFDNPKTFNEKINWIKLYWQNPLITLYADKYKVRDVVMEKIGEKYLIPLLGVWDNPEDINFDQLPDQFAIKVNWGSGQNIIVQNKRLLDKSIARPLLKEWIQPESNLYWRNLEWGYKNIPPKIIIEQYVKAAGQICYKIMCFNGQPKVVQVVYNPKQSNSTVDFFDLHWERLPFKIRYPNNPEPCTQPSNFQEMLEIARTFAKPFPFVRVDLYNIDGKVYFSECTFYSDTGFAPFEPSEWDLKLGEMLQLPEKHI